MVLEIHANRLDAQFLRETGAVDDEFTIIKGATPLRVTQAQFVNGTATLRWNSVPDREYHIEFAPTLPVNSWTNISGAIRGTDATTEWNGPASAGFYRIAAGQ
jgi:hypothetical protein